MNRGRRLGLGVAWTLCALAIATGSAGLVAGVSHQPGTSARPELTWAADQAIRPGLDEATADLVRLSAEVDALGQDGRNALAALLDRNLDQLAGIVGDGTRSVATIDAETVALRAKLAALPGAGPEIAIALGPDVLARYEAIVAALETTGGLAGEWVTFTAGSSVVSRLTTLLAEHDRDAAAAARLGSGRAYAQAITQLGSAVATLDGARALRDTLANSADVSTLDEWISRNAALDAALEAVYRALLVSNGRVTQQVRDAIAAEQVAEQNLPPDTRALVVIVSDAARGGLNQAVIAIEDAKGRLAVATQALEPSSGAASPQPSEGVPPVPSGSTSPYSATATPAGQAASGAP